MARDAGDREKRGEGNRVAAWERERMLFPGQSHSW